MWKVRLAAIAANASTAAIPDGLQTCPGMGELFKSILVPGDYLAATRNVRSRYSPKGYPILFVQVPAVRRDAGRASWPLMVLSNRIRSVKYLSV